jgi:hypothetical protein
VSLPCDATPEQMLAAGLDPRSVETWGVAFARAVGATEKTLTRYVAKRFGPDPTGVAPLDTDPERIVAEMPDDVAASDEALAEDRRHARARLRTRRPHWADGL